MQDCFIQFVFCLTTDTLAHPVVADDVTMQVIKGERKYKVHS